MMVDTIAYDLDFWYARSNMETEKEPEKQTSAFAKIYLVYLLLTILLFGFLVFMGWLALEEGWIPSRGISNS